MHKINKIVDIVHIWLEKVDISLVSCIKMTICAYIDKNKVDKCLLDMVDAGEIDLEQAQAISDMVTESRAAHRLNMDPVHAERLANKETAERLRLEAEREKKLAALRIQATDRITKGMQGFPDMIDGAIAHINGNRVTTTLSVESLERVIRGQFHALWADGIEKLRPRKLGFDRRSTEQDKVLKELFGESTGDAEAAALAKAWAEAAEMARLRFNQAGGNIAKRQDWGLPQTHSMSKVSGVTRDEWVEFITPLLDRERLFHPELNRIVNDEELALLLSDIYEQIRTNGWIDIEPGRSGKRALANKHLDHRFLVFKDADSWIDYQKRFGSGDMYSNMTHHLDAMASEIARLEVLGPNPDAMLRFMVDSVKKDAALAGEKAPALKIKFLEDSYKVASNKVNVPESDLWAGFMSGMRNILTSAQLGGAFLSAISDLSFQKITRGMNGLQSKNVLTGYFKYMNPADAEGRIFATRLGLIAESATTQALAQQRYLGEVMGPRITRLFSDTVLKASLLSPWTQAGKWAFGAEYMSFLGQLVKSGKLWGEIPEAMRRNFKLYGVDESDWNILLKSELLEKDGVPFVWLPRLMETEGAQKTANKLQGLILSETEKAVPSVNFSARALMTQGQQPGSLIGEIARSIAMYKAFPVTVINTHLMPAIRNVGTDKGRYLAELFIYTTMLGMVAYQAKQVQRGKDPISVDPRTSEGRRIWLAAMMQGGGAGIFGDFLFADQSRFGKSPSLTFAGPVAGFFDDISELTISNIHEAARGDDTNFARESIKFTQRYIPGGSLWYTRLIFERLVFDQLQLKLDPRARRSFRTIERNAKKEFGQRFWWKPGNTSPGRSPEVDRIIGGK